jgi:hypothetical protein
MILTLYGMILDTIAFVLLLTTWIFVMAAVFTTVFQDTKGETYKDLYTTVLVLWNGMLGGYSTSGIGKDLYWLHVLMTILYVYMSNILLLNYLIAIMSTTYSDM